MPLPNRPGLFNCIHRLRNAELHNAYLRSRGGIGEWTHLPSTSGTSGRRAFYLLRVRERHRSSALGQDARLLGGNMHTLGRRHSETTGQRFATSEIDILRYQLLSRNPGIFESIPEWNPEASRPVYNSQQASGERSVGEWLSPCTSWVPEQPKLGERGMGSMDPFGVWRAPHDASVVPLAQ